MVSEHWMDEVVVPGEAWTDAQIGDYLRSQGHKITDGSVRTWRLRRGIKTEPMVRAEVVRTEEARMVGRGKKRKSA